MAGLSHELLADLRNALFDCGPFYSAADLRAVFVDERLKPWRNNLPDASNNAGRVDAVISYLVDRRNRSGESALLLLVQALRDRTDPDDSCYERLDKIAKRLAGLMISQQTNEGLPRELSPSGTNEGPYHHIPSPGRPGKVDLVRLHEQLAQYFGFEDLRTLCFGLGVDFDDLPGEGKGAKARELVTYMERRGRIPDLITKAQKERPNVSW